MNATDYRAYDSLINLACQSNADAVDIEDLKREFAGEIDSLRRLECITTIPDLIDCLQRKDIITEYNIDALCRVARYTDGEELSEALMLYQMPKDVTNVNGPLNLYQEMRLSDELRHQMQISDHSVAYSVSKATTHNYLPKPIEAQLYRTTIVPDFKLNRDKIFKLLAKELGNFWRRFGRELEVSEASMDELELQYPRDLTSRIMKLLQIFESESSCESGQYILLICHALENCQRKDLRRKIERLISS